MKKLTACLALALAALIAAPALAQDHGSGGGVGCGDVFGDLIEVKRAADTGQPILQMRWVELPKEAPGYGWGYCKIALDTNGNELPFAPLSCDIHPDYVDQVVAVDYFGRLNGGRTKEKNNRMHFNEVISTIKGAEAVSQESAGRLRLGYGCSYKKNGDLTSCTEWSTIDSPMESLGLYTRLMKYGHFQTDPIEEDIWAHGDPAVATIQYNPALTPADWKKFHNSVRHLLPAAADNPWTCFTDRDGDKVWEPTEPYVDVAADEESPVNGQYDVGEPFADLNGNGIRDAGGDTFNAACAAAQDLNGKDFTRGASFLAGAANKTGKVTRDLVQYLNRILKITKKTETTVSNTKVLPALVRVCPITSAPPDPNSETQIEPTYDMTNCADPEPIDPVEADPDKIFPDLHELFVDYEKADFTRGDTMDDPMVDIIAPVGGGTWQEGTANLETWLDLRVPPPVASENIDGFVAAGTDALRTIEFIHNYAVPEHLPFFPY